MVTPAHDTRIGTCEPADQPGLERIVNAARMASSTAARAVTGIAGADGQRAQRCQQPVCEQNSNQPMGLPQRSCGRRSKLQPRVMRTLPNEPITMTSRNPGSDLATEEIFSEDRRLPDILEEASLPAVLRDHPTAVVPYLVIRDHFTERPRHPDVHPPGPRQRPISVAGDGSQTRSVCYVDDTVDGILRMHSSNIATLVNIGTPDERSVLDIARDVIAATGSRSAIAFVDRPVDDPRVRRPETTRARELLGWEPAVPWSEGLTSTISWFRTSASPGTPSSQAISARVAERLAQDSRN